MSNVRGRSSPRRFTIVLRRTTAWTTADRTNPKIRAHKICHVIEPVMVRACPMAWSTLSVRYRHRAWAIVPEFIKPPIEARGDARLAEDLVTPWLLNGPDVCVRAANSQINALIDLFSSGILGQATFSFLVLDSNLGGRCDRL
jgi:hypothetical protein